MATKDILNLVNEIKDPQELVNLAMLIVDKANRIGLKDEVGKPAIALVNTMSDHEFLAIKLRHLKAIPSNKSILALEPLVPVKNFYGSVVEYPLVKQYLNDIGHPIAIIRKSDDDFQKCIWDSSSTIWKMTAR